GLLILPIHRLVRRTTGDAERRRIQAHFDVQVLEPGPGALERALELQQAAGGVSFVVAGLIPDHLALLRLRDRAGTETLMPAARSAAWKALDVSVLQYGILEAGLGIDLDAIAAGGVVEFTEDAEEAVAAVTQGHADLAFLLRPTRPDDIFAVADTGDRM